jgi:hypothetical protein
MGRLEARVARLEAVGRNGWRAYAAAGVDMAHWSDEALVGLLAESEDWPPGYDPTEEELRAIAAGRGRAP